MYIVDLCTYLINLDSISNNQLPSKVVNEMITSWLQKIAIRPCKPLNLVQQRQHQSYEIEKRLQEKAGTMIMLLHNGEPKSPFYARSYISNVLTDRLRLPKWISNVVARLHLEHSPLPMKCIMESVKYLQSNEQLCHLKGHLEQSTIQLLPEFGPIRCLPLNQEEIDVQLKKAVNRICMDRLILLSLLPFKNINWLIKTKQTIGQWTNRLNLERTDHRDEYVLPGSSTSFSLDIVDSHNWCNSECLVQYWADQLLPQVSHYQAIIFVASRTNRKRELARFARNVMHAIYRDSPKCTLWRCGVYFSWEFPFGNFIDRMMGWQTDSLVGCVRQLIKGGNNGPFLVVPIDTLFESFDTNTTLPSLIESMDPTVRQNIHLMKPKSIEENSALIHTLAEMVKYVMLNPGKV